MLKLIANYYYIIVALILFYLTFNVTVRDSLIAKHISDAPYDGRADYVRDIFIYVMYFLLVSLFFVSIRLMFSQHGKIVNKVVLIAVPSLLLILFLCLILTGLVTGAFYY